MDFAWIPAPVRQALARLEAAGYESYAVGGCVRDALMGRACEDFDLASAAPPQALRSIFADCIVGEEGIAYGSIRIALADTVLEITSFRRERGHSDARHPDAVLFVDSVWEDLKRRDFSMNALAASPTRGLVDPFDGAADIRDRRIRCIGRAQERFSEDALRMLRALRFSACLGFSLSEDSERALYAEHERLAGLAVERCRPELERMLMGAWAQDVLAAHGALLQSLLPALCAMPPGAWQRVARSVSRLPADAQLRLAAILLELPPASAEMLLAQYKPDKQSRRRLQGLLTQARESLVPTRPCVHRQLVRYGVEQTLSLLMLQNARKDSVGDEKYDKMACLVHRLVEERVCLAVSDLALGARHLQEKGYAGSAIGQKLHALLDAVIDERVPNEKAALLAFLEGKR